MGEVGQGYGHLQQVVRVVPGDRIMYIGPAGIVECRFVLIQMRVDHATQTIHHVYG